MRKSSWGRGHRQRVVPSDPQSTRAPASTGTPRRHRRLGAALAAGGALAIATAGWLIAADHLDSPLVTNDAGADIADVYSFVSPGNPENLVLVMTLHGFIPPTESSVSIFDPNVLYQFKIDTDSDAIEDLVIQAFVTGGRNNQVLHFRGPVAPVVTGTEGRIVNGRETGTVRVSTSSSPIIATRNGVSAFAGVRDDPFFFDLGRFVEIVNGNASAFNDPGFDSFAGFNVYAIVLELPASLLGGASAIGVWGTTSRLP